MRNHNTFFYISKDMLKYVPQQGWSCVALRPFQIPFTINLMSQVTLKQNIRSRVVTLVLQAQMMAFDDKIFILT